MLSAAWKETANRLAAGAHLPVTNAEARRCRPFVAAMKSHERTKLLFGPYQAPALKRGDRVTCLFRDCDVVETG
jgi:hypothetical protein